MSLAPGWGLRVVGRAGGGGLSPSVNFPLEVACASRERNVRGTFLPQARARTHARRGKWGPSAHPCNTAPPARGGPPVSAAGGRGGGLGVPCGARVPHLDRQNCQPPAAGPAQLPRLPGLRARGSAGAAEEMGCFPAGWMFSARFPHRGRQVLGVCEVPREMWRLGGGRARPSWRKAPWSPLGKERLQLVHLQAGSGCTVSSCAPAPRRRKRFPPWCCDVLGVLGLLLL